MSAKTIDLTGAVQQPLSIDYRNTLPLTIQVKDELDQVVNLEGNTLRFEIFKDREFDPTLTIQGDIAEDNQSVSFSDFLELSIGLFWYRIVWTNDNGTFTIQKGDFNVVT